MFDKKVVVVFGIFLMFSFIFSISLISSEANCPKEGDGCRPFSDGSCCETCSPKGTANCPGIWATHGGTGSCTCVLPNEIATYPNPTITKTLREGAGYQSFSSLYGTGQELASDSNEQIAIQRVNNDGKATIFIRNPVTDETKIVQASPGEVFVSLSGRAIKIEQIRKGFLFVRPTVTFSIGSTQKIISDSGTSSSSANTAGSVGVTCLDPSTEWDGQECVPIGIQKIIGGVCPSGQAKTSYGCINIEKKPQYAAFLALGDGCIWDCDWDGKHYSCHNKVMCKQKIFLNKGVQAIN